MVNKQHKLFHLFDDDVKDSCLALAAAVVDDYYYCREMMLMLLYHIVLVVILVITNVYPMLNNRNCRWCSVPIGCVQVFHMVSNEMNLKCISICDY